MFLEIVPVIFGTWRSMRKSKRQRYFVEFHQRMYQMADVTGLYDLLNTRRAHLDRLRNLHLPQKGKASAILSEHSAIVDSLENRDPAAAEAAVRNHLKGTVSATEELRSHFPEYFAV